MWLQVLFDLPTQTKMNRKSASQFRHFLLDNGFEMSQFSVYQRICSGKEMAEAFTKRIQDNLPPAGKIHILSFTDKQYENMKTFRGKKQNSRQKNPSQLTLF